MPISSDFSIDYANKRVYYVGGGTTYSVNQLYTHLMDTFDELVQLDDPVPMSAQTPTEYTMLNTWFIDDESVKYLVSGAIATSGYSGSIQVVSLNSAGYTNAISGDIGKYVSNGIGHSGALLHYNNTSRKWWVRRKTATDTFGTPAATINIVGGTGAGTQGPASLTGEELYANVYTLGTVTTDPQPLAYVFQSGSRISSWWGRGHIDALFKVKETGEFINGAKITVFARHYSDLDDHFDITLAAGGRNAVPLATATDLNNSTGEMYLSASTTLASFDAKNFVRGNSSTAYGEIVSANDTLNRLYVGNVQGIFTAGETISETTNGLASGDTGTTATLKGASHITNVVAAYNDIAVAFMNMTASHNGMTGTFTSYEPLTWTNGRGVFLSASAAPGNLVYIGSVSGTRPTNGLGITGSTSAAHTGLTTDAGVQNILTKAFTQQSAYPYNVFVSCAGRTLAQTYEFLKYFVRDGQAISGVLCYPAFSSSTNLDFEYLDGQEYITAFTDRVVAANSYSPVKAAPFGTFAGGTFFGARGVWLESMHSADIKNYQLIDTNGSTRNPPNQISLVVGNLTASDKVAVFPAFGGAVDKAQFNIGTAVSASTTLTITGTIPSDTPSSGYVRAILGVSGSEQRYSYSGWNGSSFTVPSGLEFTYAGTDKCYVPYIESSVTGGDTSATQIVIYATDRNVLVRVRRYGGSGDSILPFETTAQIVSTGMSVTTIRTNDTIVS